MNIFQKVALAALVSPPVRWNCLLNQFASFFKNPENDRAGRLIEASKLKGTQLGGSMVSKKQANFLVNHGGAAAADVIDLIRSVQRKVTNDCGKDLEPEGHFI